MTPRLSFSPLLSLSLSLYCCYSAPLNYSYSQTHIPHNQMDLDDDCNTGLVLGLGFPSTTEIKPKSENQRPQKPEIDFEPSLTLGICGEIDGRDRLVLCRQDSGTSSFSNASVKRERSEEGEIEDYDGINIARKKLRLNRDQSAVLEESFKLHSTLNPKQKQELARKLNLRPRQVEVWFQNRRARTKLKQTEVDCEYLRKCSEDLRAENRRLQKELQELKVLKLSQPYYTQLPVATLSICPSCERISGVGADQKTKGQLSIAASKAPFFTSFTNSSAAC